MNDTTDQKSADQLALIAKTLGTTNQHLLAISESLKNIETKLPTQGPAAKL
jgi:hypothetical protein